MMKSSSVIIYDSHMYYAIITSGTSSFTRLIVCLMCIHQSSILDFRLATYVYTAHVHNKVIYYILVMMQAIVGRA